MRILVEPSGYPAPLRNVGDIAMQQTALSRLASLWPTARIQVLTDAPDQFPHYATNVEALTTEGRRLLRFGLLRHRYVPEPIQKWECQFLANHPRLARQIARLKLRLRRSKRYEVDSFLEAVREADLLVVCGMGGVADVFELYALDLLETIGLIKANGKALVVMFGQAIGPIRPDGAVAAGARKALPQVDFFGLREERASVPLLRQLGVDLSRVSVTGDDALEIAAQHRSTELGSGLGINIRVAPYSEVSIKHAQRLREGLQHFTRQSSIQMVPLPISSYSEEEDSHFIQLVTEGYAGTSLAKVDGPADLIKQLHDCRVAVLGSYHAAVFALAQGVPVIGLYKSDYYRDKFLGLEALFAVGVFPLNLADPGWTQKLSKLLAIAWEDSPILRPRLMAASDVMIQRGWQAYDHLRELIEPQHVGV